MANLDDMTLDEAIDMRSALLALQRSEGWAVLVKIWEQDLETQRNTFGGPIKSEFELYAQEYTKGVVSQIRSDIALPMLLVDTLNAQIDTHPANKENRNASPLANDPTDAGDADESPTGDAAP